MPRCLYVNPDPSTQSRATQLGCGWMASVPSQYAKVASAPCVILDGAGLTSVLAEPTTPQAVTTALQPILSAESAAAAAQAVLVTNGATIQNRAQTALTTNATYLALASPSTAQNTAQIQTL